MSQSQQGRNTSHHLTTEESVRATWQQVLLAHRDGSKFCEPLRRANGLQAYTCSIQVEKYWKGILYIDPSSPPPVREVMAEGAGFSRLEGTHFSRPGCFSPL